MDISSDKYAAIISERPLARTEGPNVPYFFVGDEGFALNRNILRPFGGSNPCVKKSVYNHRLHRVRMYVELLLVFWAINREFSSDHLMSVLTLQSSLLRHVRGLLEKYPTFGREKETGLLGALDT